MRRSALLIVGVFLAVAALGQTSLVAQGVSYTTVTSFEFGGGLGSMMSMVPGMEDETSQTTHVQGSMMRTDSGDESNIFNFSDPASPIMTVLQHPERTFYSFSFEEIQERMGAAMGGARQEQPQWEERGRERPEFDMKFSMNPTGKSKDFGDYSADQVVMVVEVVPTGEGAQEEGAGTMAIVTELWLSKDLPGYAGIRDAQKKMAEGFMGGAGMGAAFQQAFAADPRMGNAFQENMEKMKDLDGIPARTVTSFVTVPPGVELDADAVLAASDKPLSEGPGMGGMAAQGARAAARDAMKNIGGLLGRRNRQQEEPDEEAGLATQTITMRSVSTIQDVTAGPIPEAMFQPTEGYVEKMPEWMRRGGGT